MTSRRVIARGIAAVIDHLEARRLLSAALLKDINPGPGDSVESVHSGPDDTTGALASVTITDGNHNQVLTPSATFSVR